MSEKKAKNSMIDKDSIQILPFYPILIYGNKNLILQFLILWLYHVPLQHLA